MFSAFCCAVVSQLLPDPVGSPSVNNNTYLGFVSPLIVAASNLLFAFLRPTYGSVPPFATKESTNLVRFSLLSPAFCKSSVFPWLPYPALLNAVIPILLSGDLFAVSVINCFTAFCNAVSFFSVFFRYILHPL